MPRRPIRFRCPGGGDRPRPPVPAPGAGFISPPPNAPAVPFAAAPAPRRRGGGFTLLEITIVVFIVGLLALVLLPRLELGGGQHLRQEAVYLRNLLDWTWNQTLYSGQRYRMVFDLTRQQYRVERARPAGEAQVEMETVESRSLGERALELQWALDAGSGDSVVIDFSPMGPLQPVAVRLRSRDDGAAMAVRLYPGQPRATLTDE